MLRRKGQPSARVSRKDAKKQRITSRTRGNVNPVQKPDFRKTPLSAREITFNYYFSPKQDTLQPSQRIFSVSKNGHPNAKANV